MAAEAVPPAADALGAAHRTCRGRGTVAHRRPGRRPPPRPGTSRRVVEAASRAARGPQAGAPTRSSPSGDELLHLLQRVHEPPRRHHPVHEVHDEGRAGHAVVGEDPGLLVLDHGVHGQAVALQRPQRGLQLEAQPAARRCEGHAARRRGAPAPAARAPRVPRGGPSPASSRAAGAPSRASSTPTWRKRAMTSTSSTTTASARMARAVPTRTSRDGPARSAAPLATRTPSAARPSARREQQPQRPLVRAPEAAAARAPRAAGPHAQQRRGEHRAEHGRAGAPPIAPWGPPAPAPRGPPRGHERPGDGPPRPGRHPVLAHGREQRPWVAQLRRGRPQQHPREDDP